MRWRRAAASWSSPARPSAAGRVALTGHRRPAASAGADRRMRSAAGSRTPPANSWAMSSCRACRPRRQIASASKSSTPGSFRGSLLDCTAVYLGGLHRRADRLASFRWRGGAACGRPERREEYGGAIGYHAARVFGCWRCSASFLPLVGLPALVAALLAQLWRPITAPLRWLGWWRDG